MGMRKSEVGRAVVLVVLAAAVLILVAGAGVAGACKLTPLDCHLRATPDALSRTSGDVSLPDRFSAETVMSGLDVPTSFDFLPDGRVLIAEKSGLLKLVADGEVAPTPVLDLSDRISVSTYRGLVAVAVDPDFDENHFIYVVYTPKRPGIAADSEAPTHTLVSRFTVSGNTAGNERAILGRAGRAAGTCAKLPSTADCIRLEHEHSGGGIAFARDGTMFVATGDGGGRRGVGVEDTAFGAQDVDALGGKILRVTRDGQGLASNPFFDGDATSNRSKVWALGLRNPFRLALTPASGLPVVGDVGWRTADEVDVARAGVNLGWPCYEGRMRTPEFKATSRCAAMYRRGDEVQQPTIESLVAGSSSLTGGVFYTGDIYPEEYREYFYADWVRGWIRHAPLDPRTGTLLGELSEFGEGAGGPVAFRMGSDGLLYVLALNYGELYRITYSE